jgi:hypothetical protein
MGALAGGFPGLALFGGLPRLREIYRRRGISNQVFEKTLSDVGVWMEDFKDRNDGALGFARTSWLMWHFRGYLFRLGRLQFMRKGFGGEVRAFRNGRGEVTLLLNPGKKFNRYNAAGQVEWAKPKAKGCWTAAPFKDKDGFFQGQVVTHSGRALREPVKLSKKVWKQVLGPDDPVLDVHIAAEEPMDDPGCMASYAQAGPFFKRHFGYRSKGFVCWSWLFEPQFQEILPPSSNILKFQDRYHRFPVASGDDEIFRRVFINQPKDYAKAPRDTFFRRAILDFYLAGNKFTGGGAGILKTHLD